METIRQAAQRLAFLATAIICACSGDPVPHSPTEGTATIDDPMTICAPLSVEFVDCDPPALLCSVFPPQGSGHPVEHYVQVGEATFPCVPGDYACYDAAEDYCEDLEDGTPDLDIAPTPPAAPPTPGPA